MRGATSSDCIPARWVHTARRWSARSPAPELLRHRRANQPSPTRSTVEPTARAVADRVGDAQRGGAPVEQVHRERIEADDPGDEVGMRSSNSSRSRTDMTRRPRSNSVASWSTALGRSRWGDGGARGSDTAIRLYFGLAARRRRPREHGLADAASRLRRHRADSPSPLSVPARRSHHCLRARQAHRRIKAVTRNERYLSHQAATRLRCLHCAHGSRAQVGPS